MRSPLVGTRRYWLLGLRCGGRGVWNGGAVGGGDGGFIVGVGGVDVGCVTYHDAAGFGCFADYVRTPYTVFVKGVGPCSDGVDKVVSSSVASSPVKV